MIELSDLLQLEIDEEMAKEVIKNTKNNFKRNRKIRNTNFIFQENMIAIMLLLQFIQEQEEQVTRLGRNAI